MKYRGIVLLALAAAAFALLSGCAGRGEPSAALTAVEVGARIGQTADLSELKQGDAEKLRKLYHIEAGDIEDFVLYTAVSNVRADELAVIKVKDPAETEGVMDHIRQRIEAQTVKFKDYRPEEYFLIEKHVLKARGPFVLFAVSKDAGQMEQAFDEALK